MERASIPVLGLFETHLTVKDLARSVAFYRDVVGLEVAFELAERRTAFFWIGPPGESMLGLWEIGSTPASLHLHIAFRVELDELFASFDALRGHGVVPRAFDRAEAGEPSVLGWMPAAAVYFEDPDGHQLEYLAMLDAAPNRSLGVVPWHRWVAETADAQG